MDVSQLTDEQIANLTPEQIEILENDPEKLMEILGEEGDKAQETATQDPEQEDKSAANGAGEEDEPVVKTKDGKGVIPYAKHKELRVENANLREQLGQAQGKLEGLLKAKDEAKTEKAEAKADSAIADHLDRLKDEMPELHATLTAMLEGNKKQGEKLEQTLQELKREKEETERKQAMSVAEQVAEAKENNPDLMHWETSDPEAWDEALRQDEILRNSDKWAGKSYSDRFSEVVRRVRAIMPEASAPKKQPEPEEVKAKAKAKVDAAPARKPTTLSDIQGGGNPASEAEQLQNMSPFELAQKLMSMPAHKAAALRAELD
ncbi:MAG: hypothetical protein ABS69_10750 [Nitrosomonadales bacterium SCN 54-20]|nr:MAG: hypothetical protein ABS69_10750 [Nitrosomonadales bacterium SCN 54-20]